MGLLRLASAIRPCCPATSSPALYSLQIEPVALPPPFADNWQAQGAAQQRRSLQQEAGGGGGGTQQQEAEEQHWPPLSDFEQKQLQAAQQVAAALGEPRPPPALPPRARSCRVNRVPGCLQP